jgi:hypothetical protein
MGIVIPEKNSPMIPNIPIDPTGDIVLNIDIKISIDIATTKSSPRNSVTINNINEIGLCGRDRLYGYGNKRAITTTGKKRREALATLLDSSLVYHT